MVLLEDVIPQFKSQYFKNVDRPQLYEKRVEKYFEDLKFNSGFQGVYNVKGMQYHIWVEIDRSVVAGDIVEVAR